MKKIASLVIVLVLAMCLATTAFAAEGVTPVAANLYDPTVATEVTVPAGGVANVTVLGGGFDLVVSGEGAFTVSYNNQDVPAVDGVAVAADVQGSRWMPAVVKITNNSDAEVTYSMIGRFPLGNQSNPATLALGENVAEIDAGIQSYYINWTAPAAGTLNVGMPTDMGWSFTYTNFGADRENWSDDSYGDMYDSTGAVNPITIEVKAGDLLELRVNTFDPADIWNTPAGTLNINAMFTCAEHAAVKVDAVAAGCHNNGNSEHWYCEVCGGYWTDAELKNVTNAMRVIEPATGAQKVEHIEAVAPGCHSLGNTEHWVCGDCGGLFEDAACTIEILPAQRVTLPATGATTVTHVEAQEAYCHRNGMQEHWICNDCGGYFTDAECTQQVMQPRYLVIPAEFTLEYHEKVNATCVENGMEEYWYCAECDCFFTDAEGIFNIASKRLVIEATGKDHVLESYDAVDPVCHRNGNIAYAYCAECDCYFINVEGNLVNTNSKNIVILAENELKHTAKVEATCEKNGMNEYWYCDDCDCFFTDAEGKYNIAYLSLTIVATEHNYVDGKCTVCGDNNPSTGDAGIVGVVATMLVSAMSTVALVAKKKEF